jgi:stage V sporulation protein B
VTGQCLRAGLLFAGFTAGLLYALAEPLTAILYQSEQAGRLLRVFAPLALVLYLDALTDGMLKGLSEQVANVRYNTLTSALDAVLLVLLLPRWGLGGYIFAFAATHLLNFTLSLRRLLIVTGCPLRLGAALGVGVCTGAGALAAQLLPELESDPAGLLLRAAVFSGVFILAACLSGTAERCLPPSLRGLLRLPESEQKTQTARHVPIRQ